MKLRLTRAGQQVSAEPLAVAPALIGWPLASPGRRAVALGIDLAMVGLLSQFTAWGLALALLVLAWHVHQALAADGARPWLARGVAAVLAAAALAVAWTAVRPDTPDPWMERTEDALDRAEQALEPGGADAAEAREAADAAASAASGIAAVVGPSRAASVAAQVASALAAAVPATVPASAAAPPPAAELQALVDELRRLRKEHRPRSLADRIDALVTEVGLGFGWGIVYFSLLPAFWQGRTVGKAVMKLRIAELSGRPLTPLRALKRYGGYAAGFATGGLGFVQALWDPNRQGLHDKAAHTVVLDMRPWPPAPEPEPAPPPAAGQ